MSVCQTFPQALASSDIRSFRLKLFEYDVAVLHRTRELRRICLWRPPRPPAQYGWPQALKRCRMRDLPGRRGARDAPTLLTMRTVLCCLVSSALRELYLNACRWLSNGLPSDNAQSTTWFRRRRAARVHSRRLYLSWYWFSLWRDCTFSLHSLPIEFESTSLRPLTSSPTVVHEIATRSKLLKAGQRHDPDTLPTTQMCISNLQTCLFDLS